MEFDKKQYTTFLSLVSLCNIPTLQTFSTYPKMQNAPEMEKPTNPNLVDFEIYVSVLIQIDREEKSYLKFIPPTLVQKSASSMRLTLEDKLSYEKNSDVRKLKQEIVDRLLEEYKKEMQSKTKKPT